MPYAGRAAFDVYCQSMIARLPAKDRKNYIVAPNRRRAWEVAVSSAEHARMLSLEQRIDEFIPPMSSYGHGMLSNPDANGRISSAVVDNSELSSRDFDVKPSDVCVTSSAAVPLSKNDGVLEAELSQERFAAFCRCSRKSLCLTHPGFTTDQIDQLLVMQWNQLDSAAKLQHTG